MGGVGTRRHGVPIHTEDTAGDELTQVDLGQPGIVTGRAEPPPAVVKQADAGHEHRFQVPTQSREVSAEAPLQGQGLAAARKVRINQPFDGRNDTRVAASPKHRWDVAVPRHMTREGRGAPVGLRSGLMRQLFAAAVPEHFFQSDIAGPGLARQIDVAAGLTKRDV